MVQPASPEPATAPALPSAAPAVRRVGGPAAGNLWIELNGDRIGYTAWDKIEAKDSRRPFTVQGRGTTRVGSNLLQLVGSTNSDSAYRDFVQVRMEAMPA